VQNSIIKHTLILIPGLGDDANKLSVITKYWKKYGFKLIINPFGWGDKSTIFEDKLNKLLELIDKNARSVEKISLIGTSAGGSAGINAFCLRKSVINKVINICGRLKVGDTKGFRSYKTRTASSPAFASSVKICESNLKSLSRKDLSKILTIRAKYGDELVPSETTIIEGATNIELPTLGHLLSITMALTVYASKIRKFLDYEEKYS
jgi:hypothetical protein